MSDVKISVRGSAQISAAPQRATVRLSVQHSGPGREAVISAVSATAAALTSQLSQLQQRGDTLAEWSSDQLRSWSYRPTEHPGRRSVVHHAGIDFRAVFRDFAQLSRWVSDVVTLDGVMLSHIEWSLTDERRDELSEQARGAAVADAIAKAASYAHSLGLGEPRPTAVSDAGMLDVGQPAAPPMRFASHVAGAESAPGVEFAPQDVTVSVAVDARFVAE